MHFIILFAFYINILHSKNSFLINLKVIFKYYLPEYNFPSLCNLDLTLQLSKSPFSLLTWSQFPDISHLVEGDFRGGLTGVLSVVTLLGDLRGDNFVGLMFAVATKYK